jgi:hypothetical protein
MRKFFGTVLILGGVLALADFAIWGATHAPVESPSVAARTAPEPAMRPHAPTTSRSAPWPIETAFHPGRQDQSAGARSADTRGRDRAATENIEAVYQGRGFEFTEVR